MSARAPGPNAIIFIFTTVMINMMGFGVILPVMPQLIMEVTGEGVAEAARWGGLLSLAYAVMQFLMMPVMGALSDRYGRRPVLIGSLSAYTLDFLLLAFAPNLWVILAARVLAGCFAATVSTANACIADISPPEKRAANFGLLGAAFGLGFIIGPALGGVIGDEFGHRAPFFAVSALGAMNCVFGWFFLPETTPPENRRKFEWKRANAFGAFRHIARFPALPPIALIFLLYGLAQWTFASIWAYFTEERFGWTPREIGLSLMAVGLASTIVQGGLTRIVIPKIGERRAAIFSVSVAILAYVGYSLAADGWMIYALIAFGALAGFTQPALQGIVSHAAPANAQGELQGIIGSINGIAMIFGPVLMTQIFANFSSPDASIYFPGAPFLVAAFMTSIALAILLMAVGKPARA
jgi:DHA1 family tetracycline resistance protein-like MFS transporter